MSEKKKSMPIRIVLTAIYVIGIAVTVYLGFK